MVAVMIGGIFVVVDGVGGWWRVVMVLGGVVGGWWRFTITSGDGGG